MRISIIVPIYNVELYLARCLDSLVDQTYDDYEIICINDCSPDNSAAIAKDYSNRFPNLIKLIENPENLGLGRSRERALEFASGNYVMFVDSDDYVKRDYIETYVNGLTEQRYDIVVGGYIRDVDGKLTEHILSDSVWSTTTYAMACAKLFRLDYIKSNNLQFTDVSCGEDIYFSMCAFYCGAQVKVLKYAGYYYYFNRKSITGSMNSNKNHERIMSELFTAFLRQHDIKVLPESKQRVIEYTYLANMVNALVVFNRGCGIKKMKEKYDFVFSDAEEKFPNYRNNPYIGVFRPKGQTLKIKLGVGVVIGLHKIHLDKPLLYLISLL